MSRLALTALLFLEETRLYAPVIDSVKTALRQKRNHNRLEPTQGTSRFYLKENSYSCSLQYYLSR